MVAHGGDFKWRTCTAVYAPLDVPCQQGMRGVTDAHPTPSLNSKPRTTPFPARESLSCKKLSVIRAKEAFHVSQNRAVTVTVTEQSMSRRDEQLECAHLILEPAIPNEGEAEVLVAELCDDC